VDKARAENMPKDNIERAIRRGTGADKDAAAFEQVFYEGYAPHGVAVMIECVTDNRNRTVAELRHALTKAGGSLGELGSVAWQFERSAYFSFPAAAMNYDKASVWYTRRGPMTSTMITARLRSSAPVNVQGIADPLHAAKPEDAGSRMLPKQELELDVGQTAVAVDPGDHRDARRPERLLN
jgi:transcriptional/translational regulatory protein YebC/TACO1